MVHEADKGWRAKLNPGQVPERLGDSRRQFAAVHEDSISAVKIHSDDFEEFPGLGVGWVGRALAVSRRQGDGFRALAPPTVNLDGDVAPAELAVPSKVKNGAEEEAIRRKKTP